MRHTLILKAGNLNHVALVKCWSDFAIKQKSHVKTVDNNETTHQSAALLYPSLSCGVRDTGEEERSV